MYYNHRFSQFHTQNIDISKAFLSNGDEQLQINPIRCVNWATDFGLLISLIVCGNGIAEKFTIELR